jgi:hypothetical protein
MKDFFDLWSLARQYEFDGIRGFLLPLAAADFDQDGEIHQIAMMKDYAGMGFESISDFLEDAAVKREGRKPIPRLSKIVHPSKLPKMKRPKKG